MTIKFNVLSSLDEVDVWLKDLGRNAFSQATKSSMLRTKPTLKKESIIQVKRIRKAKSKAISDRFKFFSRFQGRNINNYEVAMVIERKPIRILNFIKGAHNVQKRKGKKFPFKGRRKLKVEVVPGRVRKLPQAFIERGRGGTKMVLQRQTDQPRPLRRLAGVYTHHLFARQPFTTPIEKPVANRLSKEFISAINDKMRKRQPKGTVKQE